MIRSTFLPMPWQSMLSAAIASVEKKPVERFYCFWECIVHLWWKRGLRTAALENLSLLIYNITFQCNFHFLVCNYSGSHPSAYCKVDYTSIWHQCAIKSFLETSQPVPMGYQKTFSFIYLAHAFLQISLNCIRGILSVHAVPSDQTHGVTLTGTMPYWINLIVGTLG